MMFDGGIFFLLLGTAVLMFFLKVPYREVLMFVSCAIFITLGFLLFADYDVAFNNSSFVSDGSVIIQSNTTNYIVGDLTDGYNVSSKFLATFFMVIGIIIGLISFIMFVNTGVRPK